MQDTELETNKNLSYYIAKIISYVFHPLLMPTYGFVLLFITPNYISTFTPLQAKIMIVFITFCFTFLFPAINAIILLKLKRINSLEMETPQERFLPYISSTLYYFALFYLFYERQLPPLFYFLILGASISIALTLLINFRWKISAHTIGAGGILGAILGIAHRLQINLDQILFLMIFITGLVGFARLRLNAHTPAQIYSGLLLGFILEYILMLIF